MSPSNNAGLLGAPETAAPGSTQQQQSPSCDLPDYGSHTTAECSSPVKQRVDTGFSCLGPSVSHMVARVAEEGMPRSRNLQCMRHTESCCSHSRPKSAPARTRRPSPPDPAFAMLHSTQGDHSARNVQCVRANVCQHDSMQESGSQHEGIMRPLRLAPGEQSSLYARTVGWREQLHKRLELMRREQIQSEVSECTFHPHMQAKSIGEGKVLESTEFASLL
jgi:hypothetical protein